MTIVAAVDQESRHFDAPVGARVARGGGYGYTDRMLRTAGHGSSDRRGLADVAVISRTAYLTVLLFWLLWLASDPAGAQPLVSNTITISETSGATQMNRVVSVARPFRQGEIPEFAFASSNGVPIVTQCDVKARWPDRSVKFAIVSFVIPELRGDDSATVQFGNRAGTPEGGFLTHEDMLGPDYDFDATIEMTGAATMQKVSARAMLSRGHWRYWLKGPVVTAIILDDRTPSRTYDTDFGDGSKALHPIFEAWFSPSSRAVDIGYTIENTWASGDPSKGMRDLTYGLVLKSGHTAPRIESAHPTMTHIGKSRWHKRHTLGPLPGTVRIDHNIRYLVTTRAVPNYDTALRIPESLIAAKYGEWLKAPKRLDGDAQAVGNYSHELSAAGAQDWIGLLTTWDTIYLLTMDERMREMVLGNADLAGRIPWHFREADASAGTGHYFDRPSSGSVDTHGRVVSVNARRTVSLWDLSTRSDCGSTYRPDRINTGLVTGDGWRTTRDHMPDTAYVAYLLTGRYYYLEELQYLAAFIVAHRTGCYSDTEAYHRQGHRGYLNDSQLRGDAWGFRTLAYAAFLSPDGTPEKAYFEDKLRNNIAAWEGEHDVPLSDPARAADWTWARRHWLDPQGVSPLGIWRDRSVLFVQPPLYTNGRIKSAGSGWEEHFLVVALGMAKGFGYPTDNLLRFTARLRLNLLQNPEATKYLIEAYRWPHKLTATGAWILDHRSFTAQFASPPTHWGRDSTADHGYGFIAMAALSFLTAYSVDGYSGQAAWELFKNEKPGQERLRTESPKWAILPIYGGP